MVILALFPQSYLLLITKAALLNMIDYNLQDMRPITRVLSSLQTKLRFTKVQTKVQDKIGYIYLNSPEDFNALTSTKRQQIASAVNTYERSNDVKVILFLSKVAKAFCAGANIKEFQNKTSKDFENNDIFKELHDSVNNAKKPILAGVNGVCLGGGCELALLTDLVFCSEEARFGLPELKLGLIPGIGGTQRLTRIAGKINAARYIFTSEFIPAKRAYELGIVSEIFGKDELHEKVINIAKEITNKPLSALLAAKQAIRRNENLTLNEGVALERKLFYPLFDTKGMEEGVKAFVQKRAPNHRDL